MTKYNSPKVDKEKTRRANRVASYETQDGIFREPDKIDTQLEEKWRKTAIFICYFSISATLALGIAFFVMSDVAGSPAAFAFAFGAVLDTLTSIVVAWRFCGLAGQSYSFERERRACVIIGVCFVLSAIGIACKAVHTLLVDQVPHMNNGMLIISCTSFLLLFLLAWVKFVVAYKVDSRSMRIDAFNSTAGAVIAFGMIISSVVYEQSSGIWFLDAIIALCIAFVLFVFGMRTVLELLLCRRPDKN